MAAVGSGVGEPPRSCAVNGGDEGAYDEVAVGVFGDDAVDGGGCRFGGDGVADEEVGGGDCEGVCVGHGLTVTEIRPTSQPLRGRFIRQSVEI